MVAVRPSQAVPSIERLDRILARAHGVLSGNLTVRRFEFRKRLRQPVMLIEKLRMTFFIALPDGFQPLLPVES
jgi:hypothetical protein